MTPTDDRRWHLRISENTTLCQVGGDATQADVWGHWLTADRADVTCGKCLAWMHA